MQIQIFVKFCYFLRLFFLFIVKRCDDMIKKSGWDFSLQPLF